MTSPFPQDELYALTSQMRRAAISAPSNIAEGAARTGIKEFLGFLSISRGSLSELETQILIAKDVGYLNEEVNILKRVDKMFGLFGGLIVSLQIKDKK